MTKKIANKYKAMQEDLQKKQIQEGLESCLYLILIPSVLAERNF